MPIRPKKPCSYPGCPNLTDGQYCEEHRKVARRKYDKYERFELPYKAYGKTWKKVRDKYVAVHPFCEECFKNGVLTKVEEVHHIIPLSHGGTNDDRNLMSLCQSCHNKIHRELGDR